jgi:hypothetical protein
MHSAAVGPVESLKPSVMAFAGDSGREIQALNSKLLVQITITRQLKLVNASSPALIGIIFVLEIQVDTRLGGLFKLNPGLGENRTAWQCFGMQKVCLTTTPINQNNENTNHHRYTDLVS